MRGPVVDAQRIGPAADIDAERPPRKRLLEDPLSEIAGEEQAVRPVRGESGEKPQFGDPDILRLVDDDEIERGFVGGHVRRDTTEQIRPRDGLAFGKTRPHALENRPQDLALLAADAGLAAEPGDIAVVFPTRELPRVDDLAPLADQEPRREPVPLDLRGGLAQQGLDQRRRGDVRLAERRRVEVVSDPRDRMDGDPVGDLRLVAGQGPQPDPQRVCQRLREGRQQHACLRVSPGQGNRPVQCHDRLARARTAAYPGGSVVVALDEPPLRRMQEDRPFVPRVIERPFEFLDIGQHAEPALRVGMGERIGLDRRPFRHRRGRAGRQVQQRLGSLLRQAFGDVEQRVLVGSPDLVEPFGRHAVAEQRIVGDPGEQQRLGCGRSRRLRPVWRSARPARGVRRAGLHPSSGAVRSGVARPTHRPRHGARHSRAAGSWASDGRSGGHLH